MSTRHFSNSALIYMLPPLIKFVVFGFVVSKFGAISLLNAHRRSWEASVWLNHAEKDWMLRHNLTGWRHDVITSVGYVPVQAKRVKILNAITSSKAWVYLVLNSIFFMFWKTFESVSIQDRCLLFRVPWTRTHFLSSCLRFVVQTAAVQRRRYTQTAIISDDFAPTQPPTHLCGCRG